MLTAFCAVAPSVAQVVEAIAVTAFSTGFGLAACHYALLLLITWQRVGKLEGDMDVLDVLAGTRSTMWQGIGDSDENLEGRRSSDCIFIFRISMFAMAVAALGWHGR